MIDKTSINRTELSGLVDEWSKRTFGLTFKFRPHQKETVVDILYSWLTGKDNVVLDAPTGSGKSYIAMTVAGVLSEYFKMRGYILISDLSLLKQYENDLNIYLPNWGIIRGRQTYTCMTNGLCMTSSACELKGCSTYTEIKAKFPECAPFCEYIVQRDKAISAPVTICTYSHWLIQQNYVRPKFENMMDGCNGTQAPFDRRDFVICDEGHKLQGIVQNHFSPKFGKEDEQKFLAVINDSQCPNKNDLLKSITELREKIYKENNNHELEKLINDYYSILSSVKKHAQYVKESIGHMASMDPAKTHLSKNDKMLLRYCDFIKDHHCKFEDYVQIIKTVGPDYIVKNDSAGDGTITFNCLNESYLMHKTFHHNCGKRMYMSATIGDPKMFASDIAIKDYAYYKLPIVFDYSNSPIFYVADYKMSYGEKDTSFPRILEMIEGILSMYPDKRGIIQTGSYSFAEKLYNTIDYKLRKRLLLYSDSSEKNDSLETYKYSTNKILVGPSLVEGLSLNDDLCRFQIIMKVPYPSLADKFISAKQKFNPAWYNSAASISILQGVGRGVRNEHDWCVTFILDGCYTNLLRNCKDMFADEFLKRIQIIPAQSLIIKK